MEDRTLAALLAVSVGVAALWGVATLGRLAFASPSPEELEPIENVLRPARRDAVVALHLPGSNGEAVRLARDGRGWAVNGHPADSVAVAHFWSEMRRARVVEVATHDPATYTSFGLDAEHALAVVLERARAADTLLIGDAAPGRRSFYARVPGYDAVYRVEADLRPAALRRRDEWQNRRIVALDTAEVAGLAVGRDSLAFTLTRTEGGWSVDGEPAAEVAVRKMLAGLVHLEAAGFAARTDGSDEAAPDRTLTVLNVRGDVMVALELRAGTTGWVVRREDGATAYLLPDRDVDFLTPAAEALLARY